MDRIAFWPAAGGAALFQPAFNCGICDRCR